MATINSLLFLFSTLAPNIQPPGNLPVTQVPPGWLEGSNQRYPPNAPALSQIACNVGESLRCDSHCQKNCTNYDQDFPCPDICVLGCVCIDPLIRARDGSCIMPNECPAVPDTADSTETSDESDEIQCNPDEEVSLFAHCQRNCTNVDQVIVCPGEGSRGCVCKSPKVRGPEGNCIMPRECPRVLRYPQDSIDDTDPEPSMTCPPNEEVSCFSHCQVNCTNFDKEFECPMYCKTGCICTPPLIRGPDGSCIMPERCNALQTTPRRIAMPTACLQEKLTGSCNANLPRYYFNKQTGNCERFIYGGCQGNDNNFNSEEDCEAVCKVSNTQCGSSEDCYGYDDKNDEYQNEVLKGPFDNFGTCEGENEVYKYRSSQCPDDCDNYKDTSRACKFIPSWPKCECKRGFVRGPNGNCIAPDQCPEPEKLECQNSEDCTDKDDSEKENEVLRGSLDHFESCGQNEVYRVPTQCPDTCANYKDTFRGCKLIPAWPAWPKCVCKRGFVIGPNGNCIRPEQCSQSGSSSDECPEDEEYKECGTACQKNCENYNEEVPCVAVCESGCFCKESMVRGPDGKCIYKEECPAKISESIQRQIVPPTYDTPLRKIEMSSASDDCPENEEYKVCGTACQKNCRDYDKDIPCEFKCESGCFCKEPMIRGPSGKCIYKEDCPAKSNIPRQPRRNFNVGFLPDFPKLKCGENEEFSFCAPMCPDDCTNYQEDRFCKRTCMPGCKCVDGYVKGKDGICIKKEECENKNVEDCSDLEVYDDCGSYCEKNCHNYNITDLKCEDSRCRRGCFCKSDLVRSPEGKCIMPQDCPAPYKRSWSVPRTEIRKFLRKGSGRY